MKSNRLFFIYVIFIAITAWFSIGFYQVDEHFQILEPAAWKAGWISQRDLPWEFFSAMRSAVEPTIVFLLIKCLGIFNSENPFTVTLLLRLISAVMALTCFMLWRNHVKRSPDSDTTLKWYDAALLLWFIPYMSVRFSLEIWGGCLFFISLALVYRKNESAPKFFFIAGLIAAIAFFIRFQTGLLIAGFLFYKALHLKKNFRNLIWYGAGFILASVLNVCLDRWFYQKWCFTPWNYFLENIINKHAAAFGTEPFYYYFIKVLQSALPLQGIFIIAAITFFLVKKLRDEISMAVLFFLVGHFIIGHKETRFLFPLIFILPFMIAYLLEWLMRLKFTQTIFFKIVIILTLFTNTIMLLLVATQPADFQVALQKAIYRSLQNNEAIVFYEDQNPFSRVGLKMNFYESKNIRLLPVDSLKRDATVSERVLIVTSNSSTPLKNDPGFHCIYQNIPDWVLKLNFNNWASRTWIFSIYEMRTIPINKIRPR